MCIAFNAIGGGVSECGGRWPAAAALADDAPAAGDRLHVLAGRMPYVEPPPPINSSHRPSQPRRKRVRVGTPLSQVARVGGAVHNRTVSADSYADLLETLFHAYEPRHTLSVIEEVVARARAELTGQTPLGARLELLDRLARRRLDDMPPTRPASRDGRG